MKNEREELIERLRRAFEPDDSELEAIREIGADQELSDAAVMRQALRHYQLVHVRLKAGETFSFSGDAARIAEFAGLAAPPPADEGVEDISAALLEECRKRVDAEIALNLLLKATRDEPHRLAEAQAEAAAVLEEINEEGARIERTLERVRALLSEAIEDHDAHNGEAVAVNHWTNRAREALSSFNQGGERE